ncbi:hypothetical protein FOL47_007262 [Perkinsus chesapeaki]|uniref:Uncharacterized protein n=1 Tax=Perkinsus chesapeaki TaxID=330153 RepID=A0A7J6LLU0_PERCH|nr:hypothetical protein FOL47_007262 [Perkinsus chesapeaki]
MLPRSFEDSETIVFVKSQDQSKREATKAALDLWLLKQQADAERPSEASPMEVNGAPPDSQSAVANNLPSNPAQLKRVFSLITPNCETPATPPQENRARRLRLDN